ncbi:UNVERIFIED_ORG: hypothetical protein M2438_001911 [Methylobacterium sp. SuP10 SLI 274]|uniref:helix-turn-helix domain-containing protein n=1 Tax=Methylorubrum extorquens TaxID=408 RepID=UPI00209D4E60|nr:hypothetical protein [Methylorubrum extorquens]MDF9863124.1 hypothetical protein [Methylorubrum pseudosasae]MDH6636736.1 hypothetical protein [Methylobacterium sp. SuP10 SLI 274]MDH6665913.1 hypothetical protein [Methylorubrum zatmanii]MCP1557827.1 hypothetical protein [Methylorubrum extorquens]MDF9791428.1 hypothetical protein [Methylorubrum extorquens]
MKARCTDTWPDTIRNRQAIAERWAAGMDTLAIAEDTGLTEPQVCQILARIQDTRHAARLLSRTLDARS